MGGKKRPCVTNTPCRPCLQGKRTLVFPSLLIIPPCQCGGSTRREFFLQPFPIYPSLWSHEDAFLPPEYLSFYNYVEILPNGTNSLWKVTVNSVHIIAYYIYVNHLYSVAWHSSVSVSCNPTKPQSFIQSKF